MRTKRWTKTDLEKAVANAKSVRQVLKFLGLREAGGNYQQIKKYIAEFKFSTAHFSGQAWNKGLRGLTKKVIPLEFILIKNSLYQSYKLKKRLFAERIKNKNCELCDWCEQASDGRIPLELDHINGNRYDNRIENLRVLCPNWHSLQSTHRGLNRKKKG